MASRSEQRGDIGSMRKVITELGTESLHVYSDVALHKFGGMYLWGARAEEIQTESRFREAGMLKSSNF